MDNTCVYNPMTLVDKTILVTGASSGIGQAIAIECSKLGAAVICTARNEERLKQTLSMMNGAGHQYLIADLTDSASIDSLVEQVPKLDGVSHNAGIANLMLCSFMKDDIAENVYLNNAHSVLQLQTRLFKKRKIKKGASLVFMSSVASIRTQLGNAAYGMAKAALATYAKYVAQEFGSKGIRSNSIHPAMVETPLIVKGEKLTAEDYAKDMKRYPLGRYGQPEDIAHLAAFLLSDASSWITGSQYVIDGGVLLS